MGKPGLVLYQQNFSLTLYQMWGNLGWFFTNKLQSDPLSENSSTLWFFTRKSRNSQKLACYQQIKITVALSGYLPENRKLNFTKVGLLPTKQNYCGTVWLFTRKITNADRRQNTYLILVECTCTFIASYLGSPTSDFKNFKT